MTPHFVSLPPAEILMQLRLNQKKAILSPLYREGRMVPALISKHLIMFRHKGRWQLTQNALGCWGMW